VELPRGSRKRTCDLLQGAYQTLRDEFPSLSHPTTIILLDFYLSMMKTGKLECPGRSKKETEPSPSKS
jgi:hypothetical protein